VTPASPVDRLTASAAGFGRILQQVVDTEWDLPTPCQDWDVRHLVAHVVLGDVLLAELLEDRVTVGEVVADPSVLGHAPMAAWRGSALRMLEAVRRPDALDRLLPHAGGEVPAQALVELRITEHLVHGWDLGTAIGVPAVPPDDLAEAALEAWLPLVDLIAESGRFGPGPQLPPPGAGPGARLLALLGRTLPS
jgi:uncharacterized protein (TIGR03086 family)